MDRYSSPVSYFWGAICALLGVFSLNEIAVIIGIILSVAAFFINLVYKRRDFQHKKKLRELFYEKYHKNITKIATAATSSVSTIIGIVLINFQNEIRTSQAGLEIIGNAESCRNKPYYCPANILTVGVGSTTGTIENRHYSNEEIAARWVT